MAAQKITDLDAATAVADSDQFLVTADPTTSPQSKKVNADVALRLSHGYLSVADGSASQTLVADTWTKVTQFTAEVNYNSTTTASHANDQIAIANAGQYLATWMVTFTGATTSEYQLAVYYNGSLVLVPAIITTTSTNEHAVTVTVPLNVTSGGNNLEAYVKSDGANAFAVKQSVMTVTRVA